MVGTSSSTSYEPPFTRPIIDCQRELEASYSTVPLAAGNLAHLRFNSTQLDSWEQSACRWEDMRHSGYFAGFENAEAAQTYAARSMCRHTALDATNLEDVHISFVGASVMRQMAIAALCQISRLRRVVEDNSTWSPMPNRRYGTCPSFERTTQPPLRHCAMTDGCVLFERNVRVCYDRFATMCIAQWAITNSQPTFHLQPSNVTDLIGARMRVYPTAQHVLVIANGPHPKVMTCTTEMWTQLAERWPSVQQALPRPLTVYYREFDGTHFPTRDGVYDASANHSSPAWHCVLPEGVPKVRQFELEHVVPIVRGLPRWHLLETFENDWRHAIDLHSTYAKVASHAVPVDCLHWVMPGVPDVWAHKLLHHFLSRRRIRRAPFSR